jgi:hypothetical protein
MKKEESGFIDFLKGVPDHRIERRKLHKVEEILVHPQKVCLER